MSLKICTIISIALVLSSGQESDIHRPTAAGTVKETVYDIQLFVSIPATVIALGLLLCLCYCVFGSCKDNNPVAFQPVIMTNRNSPLVVAAQSTSHNDSVAQVHSNGSVSYQQNISQTPKTPQNANATGQKGKPVRSKNQVTGGRQSTQTKRTKGTEHGMGAQSVGQQNQSQPIQTTGQPIQTTGQPIQTTGQPIHTAVQPIQSSSRPIETIGQPIQTTSQPIQSTTTASSAQSADSVVHLAPKQVKDDLENDVTNVAKTS